MAGGPGKKKTIRQAAYRHLCFRDAVDRRVRVDGKIGAVVGFCHGEPGAGVQKSQAE